MGATTQDSQKNQYLKTLFDFLSIPSVSTDSRHQKDMNRSADFLVDYFKNIGCETVQKCETPKHSAVLASWIPNPELPTVLIYGHYDVQPPEPLELWESPAFSPEIRNGYVYARGASDDKGQILCHILAVENLLKRGSLPVNVIFLIEGEEEIGSPNLGGVVDANRALLSQADIVVVSDTPMFAPGVPSICTSLRGLVYLELTATGPNSDLHSGQNGGTVPNPIQALAHILSQLKGQDGRIQIPEFYRDVLPITDEQKKEMARLPFDQSAYLEGLGLTDLACETGYSPLECLWYRPTLDCNGIWGGFTGEGAKTVIPRVASAKLSMRLVANQDPAHIIGQVRTMLKEITPPGIQLTVDEHSAAPAVVMDISHPAFSVAKSSVRSVFGVDPVFHGEGGSIPILKLFKAELGLETILMGFNLPDDNIHAPNERFLLDHFYKGIQTSEAFLSQLGQKQPG